MTNAHANTHKRPSRFAAISKSARHVGRVIAFLTREQLDFIDKISKDALYSTGKKLPRTAIIQAIIEAIRRLDLSGEGVHSQDELEEKIGEVAKKSLSDIAEELKKGTKKDEE
jgi:hypothetical protein